MFRQEKKVREVKMITFRWMCVRTRKGRIQNDCSQRNIG